MIITKLRARILPAAAAAAAVEALNARKVEQDNQKKESSDKSYNTNPIKLPARILQAAAAEPSSALKKSRTSSRKKAILTEAITQIRQSENCNKSYVLQKMEEVIFYEPEKCDTKRK
jgi:hypothetical protein